MVQWTFKLKPTTCPVMQIGERSQVVVVDKNSLYHLQQPDNITTAGFGTALSRGAERMLKIDRSYYPCDR